CGFAQEASKFVNYVFHARSLSSSDGRAEYGLASSLWETIFWVNLVSASLCAAVTGSVESDFSVVVTVDCNGPARPSSSVLVPHAARVTANAMAAPITEIPCFIRGASNP